MTARAPWIICLLAAGTANAAGDAPVVIEPFTLPDSAGKPWTLPVGKPAVVVFVGNVCPINVAFLPTLARLHEEYAARGVTVVAINANPQDDVAKIAELVKNHGLPFPILKDSQQAIADRFGARFTPEAFVLDAKHQVRYRGRINDQFGFGYQRKAPTRRDVNEALDEVLAGKPVTVAKTDVEGCVIARSPKPKSGATVTFGGDVARIIHQNCTECHRAGQIGPMPLVTYDDVAPWAETIRMVIEQKRMPPWHADPKHGSFSNARVLADADRKLLLDWIDQGCAPGDLSKVPPAKPSTEGWTIGKPDAVFTMPFAYNVPAEAGPRGVAYKYFTVSTNFEDDMWIQAAEARPGARAVVHHIIVYVMKQGERPAQGEDRVGQGMLVAYAPGDMPSVFPAGQAKRIPKGSVLLFQMHYTPNGTAVEDRSSVGLIFAKERPKYEVKTRGVMNPRFQIPPGDDNHKVQSSSTIRKDAMLVNLLPHMHLRGKSFNYDIVYPDGKRETLLYVPKYDFNWQSNYRLTEPLKMPAGTRIECTAWFDNSDKNKSNPDPTKAVRWGDQTWEEMMIGFIDYVYELDSK